jgi:hypothetical protein
MMPNGKPNRRFVIRGRNVRLTHADLVDQLDLAIPTHCPHDFLRQLLVVEARNGPGNHKGTIASHDIDVAQLADRAVAQRDLGSRLKGIQVRNIDQKHWIPFLDLNVIFGLPTTRSELNLVVGSQSAQPARPPLATSGRNTRSKSLDLSCRFNGRMPDDLTDETAI